MIRRAPTVAALYVDKRGPYMDMEGVDPWTIDRDAKLYDGPSAVVAHPPCADWGAMRWAARNDPERKSNGPRAVRQVRAFGGVLEHPAKSALWRDLGLPKPRSVGVLGRSHADAHGGWTIVVNQVDWGHQAAKQTWLYIVGVGFRDIPPMPPARAPTHVVSALGRRRRERSRSSQLPEMSKRDRHLTPPAFAAYLVDIARRAS